MFDSENYSDVTLQCEGIDIKCHRNILSFYSPVLDRLFLGEFEEKSSRIIKINDVKCDVLTKAIHFIYGKGLVLTNENVMDMLAFSDMYDIAVLQEVCSDMLLKNIDPTIAVTLWQWGKKYNARKIIEACNDYCAKHFGQERHHIVKTRGYLEAEKDIIVELLSSRFLYVADEEEAFRALLDWVLFDADARADNFDELLSKCVNVQHLTSQCVMNFIKYLSADERIIRENLLDLAEKISTGRASPMTVCSRLNTKYIDVLQWSVCPSDGARCVASMPLYRLYRETLNFTTNPLTMAKLQYLHESATYWPLKYTGCTVAEFFVFDAKMIACTASPANIIFAEAEEEGAKCLDIPDNYSLHFHQLPDGKLLYLMGSNPHRHVYVKKVADFDNFVTEYETVTSFWPSGQDCLRLSVHYAGFIFVFDTGMACVHLFDTGTGSFVNSQSLPFARNDEYHLITSCGSVACLLTKQEDIVVVVLLDELLARLTRRLWPSGVKRRRLDDSMYGCSTCCWCDFTAPAAKDSCNVTSADVSRSSKDATDANCENSRAAAAGSKRCLSSTAAGDNQQSSAPPAAAGSATEFSDASNPDDDVLKRVKLPRHNDDEQALPATAAAESSATAISF